MFTLYIHCVRSPEEVTGPAVCDGNGDVTDGFRTGLKLLAGL